MSEEHTHPAAPRQGRSQRAAARNNKALYKAFLAELRKGASIKVCVGAGGWAGGLLSNP